ncbi:TatD family hydrolase [Candidatus Saccharibacteria bacterium]|jgi:TatD DNase family protein|nr:TatD family hydrolase [Candidatus Saccharibacteria bacterium]
MHFIDTHCHIHSADYKLDPEVVLNDASNAGVTKLICVGTDIPDSHLATNFANDHENVWASVGLHPHDSKLGSQEFIKLEALATEPKVVAVGECGLDYFYNHSSKTDQVATLEFQIDLAERHKLAMIFHVRDAFGDFWPIFDNFSGIRGVIHSFTASTLELEQALKRNLYIGINGIMTFTKDTSQLEAVKKVPLNKLVLETDAPFLTPVPLRGKINQPKNTVLTGEFLARLRGENLDVIAASTTKNAEKLFDI